MPMTAAGAPAPTVHVEECMGTVFSLAIYDPGDWSTPIQQAISWLNWVDATFSAYRPDSQINQLDRGEITRADSHPLVAEVLDKCAQLSRQTNGYFTSTPGGHLDPSALVKGWAIEHASATLRTAGAHNHALNGGGDIQAAGQPTPGQPWRIGIADPHHPGKLATIVTGSDIAVATSGTAERGQHIIDPHTGSPATSLASITLVGHHLAAIDAYATAAFAMGHAAHDWVTSLPDVEAFAVTADGHTWSTANFPHAT